MVILTITKGTIQQNAKANMIGPVRTKGPSAARRRGCCWNGNDDDDADSGSGEDQECVLLRERVTDVAVAAAGLFEAVGYTLDVILALLHWILQSEELDYADRSVWMTISGCLWSHRYDLFGSFLCHSILDSQRGLSQRRIMWKTK